MESNGTGLASAIVTDKKRKPPKRTKGIERKPPVVGKIVFHSVTIPQSIEAENDLLKMYPDVQLSLNKKLTCGKIMLHVLYYQPVAEGWALRRRRIVIGKKDVMDISNGVDKVNPLILKSLRTRSKEFVINGECFNADRVKKQGGFFSKKFWQYNLLWGPYDTMELNLAKTAQAVKKMMPTADNELIHALRATKSTTKKEKGKSAKKTSVDDQEKEPGEICSME